MRYFKVLFAIFGETTASFQKATGQRKNLETKAPRFTFGGIILSALATFVAGVPSIMGQTFIGDWRLTCSVAAIITLAANIITSLHNQIPKPDTLTLSSESVVRLRVLLIEM